MQASDRLPTAVSVYVGWGKEKTIHPKTKGLERRKKPTQEQSTSTVQTKQQHRKHGKRCEGGDTQIQTPAPSRHCLPEPPQEAAPTPHTTAPAPVHCPSGDRVLSPALQTRQPPAGADSGDPPSRWPGRTKPSRKMRHQLSQHIPMAHSHLLGESSCPSRALRLPGNQTPPHRHSALLAQVKREQSSCRETTREHPGPQVPEWEGG